jgi:hypothetical protein
MQFRKTPMKTKPASQAAKAEARATPQRSGHVWTTAKNNHPRIMTKKSKRKAGGAD